MTECAAMPLTPTELPTDVAALQVVIAAVFEHAADGVLRDGERLR